MKLMRKAVLCASMAVLLPCAVHAAHVPPAAAQAAFDRAGMLSAKTQWTAAADALIQAIDADPEFIAAHEQLQLVSGDLVFAAYNDKKLAPQSAALEKAIDAKYKEWEQRHPDSIGILYGIGNRLASKERPGARGYLLKVIQRDPSNSKAYALLSDDAERRGEQKTALEYMRKAASAEPHNPDYAFHYASQLQHVDRARWEAASLDIARRFPTSERGAQALYWLGMDAGSDASRIAVWKQLRSQFPPQKFNWSDNAMPPLFDAYLRTDPAKALAFAGEMKTVAAKGAGDEAKRSTGEWAQRITLAQTVVAADRDLAQGKPDQAMALLDKLATDRMSSNAAMIVRLKARIMAAAGKPQEAYASLLKQQAKVPDDNTRAALRRHGEQLGKTDTQVEADLDAQLDAESKPASPFTLHAYGSDQTVSLDQLKGKVVFITFWFPGCGPCRAEFPHLEKATEPFRSRKDFAYLGINIVRDQDDFVESFMQQTKYSFTPLKGEDAVIKIYNKMGFAPYNILIDRSGRIVYSGFMATDADKEQVVQRMIGSLMARKAPSAAAGVKS